MLMKKKQANKSSGILTERDEQKKVIQYLEILKTKKKIIDYHSTPNENYLLSLLPKKTSTIILSALKAIGLKKGVPDLYIFGTHKMIAIEMKRSKKYSISEYQKIWNEKLNKTSYCEAYICPGAESAIYILKKEFN